MFRWRMTTRAVFLAALAGLCVGVTTSRAADSESMSLDSLMAIPVSSASKYEQTVAEAPASVTVLTAEDIQRYGWSSLNEALQSVSGLVSHQRPHLHVYRHARIWPSQRLQQSYYSDGQRSDGE